VGGDSFKYVALAPFKINWLVYSFGPPSTCLFVCLFVGTTEGHMESLWYTMSRVERVLLM